VSRLLACAKINLALVVGPLRPDGKHEVATVLERLDLADRISVNRASGLRVEGFAGDTLVRRALIVLAEAAGVKPGWRVEIDKRIPVAAGLGGGSSDAAAALRLANETLERPHSAETLVGLAASIGADVPFFLTEGPQLGRGDGSEVSPVDVSGGYRVVLCLPDGVRKHSTAAVYDEFDARGGAEGFTARREALLSALAEVREPHDLAALPLNDLASSPLAEDLRALGAFRADVSGAGPVVYGLFEDETQARTAAAALERRGRTWICVPAWYG
jgi:4-diphosphocytidyl-2-C-methyl-D-erythritol kinase